MQIKYATQSGLANNDALY